MYAQNRKIGKPNDLKFCEQRGPKHDTQDPPRPPKPEGGEP